MKMSKQRIWLIAGAAVLVVAAATLSILKIQTGKTVGAPALLARSTPALPAAPWDSGWSRATAVKLPLSALATPDAKPREVTVRALTDGKQLAIRLEWADGTQEVTTLRPQDFADAAAIELANGNLAACMGQADGFVHIWQWKADWQYGSRDMQRQFPNLYTDGYSIDGQPLFTEPLFTAPASAVGNPRALARHDTPVEHLIAGGFSTLTTAPGDLQTVGGNGAWQSGKWAVQFVRDLGAKENDFPFQAGTPLQVAFAVWDGKLMQRDGMKYTTGWATLTIPAR